MMRLNASASSGLPGWRTCSEKIFAWRAFARRHNRGDSFARRRDTIWLASARIADFCEDASSFLHQPLERLVKIDLQHHMHQDTKLFYIFNGKHNKLASTWAMQTKAKLVAFPVSHFPWFFAKIDLVLLRGWVIYIMNAHHFFSANIFFGKKARYSANQIDPSHHGDEMRIGKIYFHPDPPGESIWNSRYHGLHYPFSSSSIASGGPDGARKRLLYPFHFVFHLVLLQHVACCFVWSN